MKCQMKKGKYHRISHTGEFFFFLILTNQNKNRYREKRSDYWRERGWGKGEKDKGGQLYGEGLRQSLWW